MTSRGSIDPITNKRFEFVRELGEGATGAVFLAHDRETGEQLAVKKLFRLDQKSVGRFKREFRALADIIHPNLVKLYDLHRGDGAWFITMEYVSGSDLRQHFGADARSTRENVRPAPANDNEPDELLRVFYGLACGVHAIHRAGMLHRDLKPSNVLVSDAGRVVVLDFGLVRELDNGSEQITHDGTVAGTPAYMAPEQSAAETLTEAADWYAFGVMLYEAISGVLPIDGKNALDLIRRKLRDEPVPLRHGAPGPVLDLCMALLARTPAARPVGAAVLNILAAASGSDRELTETLEQPVTNLPVPGMSTPTLFGREVELAALHAATAALDPRSSPVVHVRGASGSGKSTLVEHFLDELASETATSPVILRSRCYEREAMPFKALDGVMDVLVAHLAKLDDVTCAHVLPAHVVDLARLFPALERLGAVQRLKTKHRTGRQDQTQSRRQAEQALRSLIANAAEYRSLIVWIDDLQWGDLDSANVLQSWLEHPLEAQVLILLSYRSEEVHTSATLRALLEPGTTPVRTKQSFVNLELLQPSDVRALCMHRLVRVSAAPEAMIERVVQEARGNPFLAQQLTALAEAKLARNDTSLDGLSMEALVAKAGAYLGEAARAILNVLATAGRPLRAQLALSVANVFSAGRAHIHTLRALHLVRSREVGGERMIECYHDRVREAVQSTLSSVESQHIHASLLAAAELEARDDHDWLHTLALGAGKREQAFRYGWLAAERASEGLAFERAAELYSKCLVLFSGELDLYVVWMKLAAAQAQCRRGYEAAKSYLSAAEHAQATQRPELLQLAASHLVRSGRFEEGERIVLQVLRSQGLYVPTTRAGLLAALGWEQSRIALRSLDVPTRDPNGIPARTMQTLTVYGILALETQLYAPLRSAVLQARSLRLALDYGTPSHVARTLCLAAALACVAGTPRAARRADQLLARAEALYRRDNDQEWRLELLCTRAVCAQFVGNLVHALEPADAAEQLLASAKHGNSAQGDYYYIFTTRMVRITALQGMGRLIEARQALDEHLALARSTDNVLATLQVTMNRTVDEQARDMCAGTRARLDAEYNLIPKSNFSLLTAAHVLAVMRAACATREFDWAFERVDLFWKPYLRSLVHRSAFLAVLAHGTHARLLLNHHVESGASGDAFALVRDDITKLRRLPLGVMRDISISRLQARVAYLRGDRARAIELLRPGLDRLKQMSLVPEIAHDHYALGLLVGGDEGTQLVASARQLLSECGVSDPDANMRAYVPELMLDVQNA